MAKLLLHPGTERQLQAQIDKPAHALLIVGPSGSGKAAVARYLAEQLLGLKADSFASYPYAKHLASIDGKAIGIEAVRQLEQFISRKIPSKKLISRVALIENAHLLTTEAQNALLKTLEEPPHNTVILLTATQPQALLPTITSRSQQIAVLRPTQSDTADYFKTQGHDDKAISQALLISGGLTGLMHALLAEDEEHPLVEATNLARQILQGSPHQRLLTIDLLAKQRQLALDTLFILQQMAQVSLPNSSGKSSERWTKVLGNSYHATVALQANAQPKLALTNLMLNL